MPKSDYNSQRKASEIPAPAPIRRREASVTVGALFAHERADQFGLVTASEIVGDVCAKLLSCHLSLSTNAKIGLVADLCTAKHSRRFFWIYCGARDRLFKVHYSECLETGNLEIQAIFEVADPEPQPPVPQRRQPRSAFKRDRRLPVHPVDRLLTRAKRTFIRSIVAISLWTWGLSISVCIPTRTAVRSLVGAAERYTRDRRRSRAIRRDRRRAISRDPQVDRVTGKRIRASFYALFLILGVVIAAITQSAMSAPDKAEMTGRPRVVANELTYPQ